MALRDPQIDRYSRQIILPEIGGRGQERLLASVVAVTGAGHLAATAARYLAGAGIGTLHLDGAGSERLGRELRALNPDVTVGAGSADAATTVVVAADLSLAALDRCVRDTRALGVPLAAAAARNREGWRYVTTSGDGCAGCAARSAPWTPGASAASPLAPVATGVLGSLLALSALKLALGLPGAAPAPCWFDAGTAALTPLPLTRFADCGGCSPPRAGEPS